MPKTLYVLKVTKSYGERGEVLTKIFIDNPLLLKKYPFIYFSYKGEERRLKIKNIRRRGGKSYIVKFEEINSKEKAESLKGIKFYLKIDEFENKEKENFIDKLIIDFEVIDRNLGKLGVIENVEKGVFYDNLHVKNEKGETFIIPFVSEFVKKIDKKNEKIYTDCEKIIEVQK